MIEERHCERSEAIHLRRAKERVDCFVALLLAMTGNARHDQMTIK
jgi:hypothetical protein